MMKYVNTVLAALVLVASGLGPWALADDCPGGFSVSAQLCDDTNQVLDEQVPPTYLQFPNQTFTVTARSTTTVSETDIGTTTPAVGAIPVAESNGKLNLGWMPIVVDSGALYFDGSLEPYPGYQHLTPTPTDSSEETDSAIPDGLGARLIEEYATPEGYPGTTIWQGGSWRLVLWRYVDNTVGITTITARFYRRNLAGTETELFNLNTGDINDTTVTKQELSTTQADFVGASTDRLVVKLYASTSTGDGPTVSITHNGTTHYSHINTPFTAGPISDAYPTGSGVSGYLAKWTDASTLGSSVVYESGSTVGIGTTSPSTTLDVNGAVKANNQVAVVGGKWVTGPDTATDTASATSILAGTATQTLSLTSQDHVLHCINGVLCGTTYTELGTTYATGTVTGSTSQSPTTTRTATATVTYSGTGLATATYGAVGSSTTERTATVTGTATVTTTVTAQDTFTLSTTLTGTASSTSGGTQTFTSTATGSQTGSGSVLATGTGTCSEAVTYIKTFTGSGTMTITLTMTDTHTATATATGTITASVISTATGTSTLSWSGTTTQVATATQANISDDPYVLLDPAYTTGTGTDTGTGTGTGSVTDTVTHTLAIIAPNATLTYTVDNTNTLHTTDIATYTPTANQLPIADGNGKLDAWVSGSTVKALSSDLLSSSFVSVDASDSWTTIFTKSLLSSATLAYATSDATLWCSAATTMQVRLLLNGSSAMSASPRINMSVSDYKTISVSGVAGFAAGTNSISLQARSPYGSSVCRVYGGSELTGITVIQL